jgi:uncharacterized membrane protein YgcG
VTRFLPAPLLLLGALVVLLVASEGATPAAAQEPWVIASFAADLRVRPDGAVEVTEVIAVDFGALRRHGIFRDIPVEHPYDTKHHRSTPITVLAVDDGAGRRWRYETFRNGDDLRIKIGDPDLEVTGRQTYRIRYRIRGALNAFADHDELYWNVTGHGWLVPIARATARVEAPAVTAVTCFQGPFRSNEACGASHDPSAAEFAATRRLGPAEGLTVVVAMPSGLVRVEPPLLIELKSPGEIVADFLGLRPPVVAGALALALVALGAVYRLWWLNGRDRWAGDVHYLTGSSTETRKPIFARETVVPEYTPPEVGKGPSRRRLRPAELGLLLDERADTLDVSATIVDLAVRGYLRIVDEEKKVLLFVRSRETALQKVKDPDGALLPYEAELHKAIFLGRSDHVRLSDLKEKFHGELDAVKRALYQQGVKSDKLFPANPRDVRSRHLLLGIGLTALGAAAVALLGLAGAGLLGLPVVAGGLGLAAVSPAMPRRTAAGRELYRRTLGFREYMVIAETDRQRFAEEVNLFNEYMPYAIVFGCTDRWARAFEGLARKPDTSSWYVSSRHLALGAFAAEINAFSVSVASVMSSTASSGGSGFGGSGFSGGGGGSW